LSKPISHWNLPGGSPAEGSKVMEKERKSQSTRKATSSEGKQSKNETIEVYLNRNYAFRFNTVKCKPEYKTLDSCMPFIPVTRFVLNSFKRELDKSLGICTSADNIRGMLESDFSPKINLVHDYFKNPTRLNPEINRYIETLAETAHVTNPEKWLFYLTKWLVGVVAL
jgi:hypothetical protein